MLVTFYRRERTRDFIDSRYGIIYSQSALLVNFEEVFFKLHLLISTEHFVTSYEIQTVKPTVLCNFCDLFTCDNRHVPRNRDRYFRPYFAPWENPLPYPYPDRPPPYPGDSPQDSQWSWVNQGGWPSRFHLHATLPVPE